MSSQYFVTCTQCSLVIVLSTDPIAYSNSNVSIITVSFSQHFVECHRCHGWMVVWTCPFCDVQSSHQHLTRLGPPANARRRNPSSLINGDQFSQVACRPFF